MDATPTSTRTATADTMLGMKAAAKTVRPNIRAAPTSLLDETVFCRAMNRPPATAPMPMAEESKA